MQNEPGDTMVDNRKVNSAKEISIFSSKAWIHCAGDTRFGHPRIFLDLSKTGDAICPYCSCRYIVKK